MQVLPSYSGASEAGSGRQALTTLSGTTSEPSASLTGCSDRRPIDLQHGEDVDVVIAEAHPEAHIGAIHVLGQRVDLVMAAEIGAATVPTTGRS
jgi:hypothetical protein